MKNASFKKSKMGQLPGDVSIRTKIRMMESNEPIKIFLWHEINTKAIKAFRKVQKRKAEKRLRQKEQCGLME